MNRKCISMIVLLTFFQYLIIGCTKTNILPKKNLYDQTMKCCIYEVRLTTGEKYKFQRPGGHHNIVKRLISGNLTDGKRFFVDLDDENINEIQTFTGEIISKIEIHKYHEQKIHEIVVGKNTYTFDQDGGKLQNNVETIYGKLVSGATINVPIEEIDKVKITQFAGGRTAGLGAGVVLLVVVVVVLAAAFLTPSFGNSIMQ